MASQVFPMQGNPRQIFVPYNAKIADITHADTNKHLLTLANVAGTGAIAGETRKVIAVSVSAERVAGVGAILVYPNEGALSASWLTSQNELRTFVIANGTQRLQYALSAANDDFDLYCFGYVVEV